MSATTTETVTREAIEQFVSQLTDQQKKYVLLKLFGPVLAPIKERRAIYDEHGNLLGDYVPIRQVQPGEKVTMSDEAREALAKTVCKTRAEWEAEYAAKSKGASEAR
jgi:hypothetical protein